MNPKILFLVIFVLSKVSGADFLYTEETIKAFGDPTPNCFSLPNATDA